MTAGSIPPMATYACTNCDTEITAEKVDALPCWWCGQLLAPGFRSMLQNSATWRAEDAPE